MLYKMHNVTRQATLAVTLLLLLVGTTACEGVAAGMDKMAGSMVYGKGGYVAGVCRSGPCLWERQNWSPCYRNYIEGKSGACPPIGSGSSRVSVQPRTVAPSTRVAQAQSVVPPYVPAANLAVDRAIIAQAAPNKDGRFSSALLEADPARYYQW